MKYNTIQECIEDIFSFYDLISIYWIFNQKDKGSLSNQQIKLLDEYCSKLYNEGFHEVETSPGYFRMIIQNELIERLFERLNSIADLSSF